jgi:hypothetical protein
LTSVTCSYKTLFSSSTSYSTDVDVGAVRLERLESGRMGQHCEFRGLS